jgi:acetolactate synthase-1/2/3 large subunit
VRLKLEESYNIGEAMMDVFRAYGVEYIFSSPGTESAPLWDAASRAKAEGRGPAFFDVRHEDLAVSVAMGYYQQSKKLPVVTLHTGVGLLHGAMALRNATHERVPMVVLAGHSGGYGEVPGLEAGYQWGRELSDSVDPEGIARPFVKVSRGVSCRDVLLGTLQDACRLALTPPMGPVCLAIPMEHMYGTCPPFKGRVTPPPLPTQTDPSALEQVAEQLIQAKRPVILTDTAGRDPRNVPVLVELAEALSIPVVEAVNPGALNFPHDHALYQGSLNEQFIRDADMLLAVGMPNPWYPASKRPPNARAVLIDDDPGHELEKYWGYQMDVVIAGEINASLRNLNAAIRSLGGIPSAVREERFNEWQQRHAQQWEEARSQALAVATQRPIAGSWMALALSEVLPRDAIVVGESIVHRPLVTRYLRQSLPGTYAQMFHGGLGVGMGVALGIKVAAPDKLVVAVEGDGAFSYNPVVAALGFSQQFKAPILTLVMNNAGYAAMRRAHINYFPEGWSVRTGTFYGSDITPSPDYGALARAFGGYGERVDDPSELTNAYRRSIDAVNSGQPAILDIVLDTLTPSR